MSKAETELARVGQRVHDLVGTVRVLEHTVDRQVQAGAAVGRLEVAMQNVEDDIREMQTSLEKRDTQATEERRSVRVALIALTGVIAAALIAGLATIIAAGLA